MVLGRAEVHQVPVEVERGDAIADFFHGLRCGLLNRCAHLCQEPLHMFRATAHVFIDVLGDLSVRYFDLSAAFAVLDFTRARKRLVFTPISDP